MVFRAGHHRSGIDFVALHDLMGAECLAHLLRFDSVQGTMRARVEWTNGSIVVDGRPIQVFTGRRIRDLPWSELGVDIVIESTGQFLHRDQIAEHLEAGAHRVILTVPARDDIDCTIVLGVNDSDLTPESRIVSNASCTTNCVALMAKVLNDRFGIRRALMNTVHSYTNDQSLHDTCHRDLRRARAAALSIIPTTTGAVKAVKCVLPELAGRIEGCAMRVPVPNGSLVDLVAEAERAATVDAINAAFKEAAENGLKGYLEYSELPLVSVDIFGNSHSCIFDALSTTVLSQTLLRVVGWYDNEWGYACRVVDLIERIGRWL